MGNSKKKSSKLKDSQLNGVTGGVERFARFSTQEPAQVRRAPDPAPAERPRRQVHFDDSFGIGGDAARARRETLRSTATDPAKLSLSKEKIAAFLAELGLSVSTAEEWPSDPMALRDSLLDTLNGAQSAALALFDAPGISEEEVFTLSKQAQKVMSDASKKMAELDENPVVQKKLSERTGLTIGQLFPNQPARTLVVRPSGSLSQLPPPADMPAPETRMTTGSTRGETASRTTVEQVNKDMIAFLKEQPRDVLEDLRRLDFSVPAANTPLIRQFLGLAGVDSARLGTSSALVTVPKSLTPEMAYQQFAAFFNAQSPKLMARIMSRADLDTPAARRGFVGQFLEAARAPTIEHHSEPAHETRAVTQRGGGQVASRRTEELELRSVGDFFSGLSPRAQIDIAQLKVDIPEATSPFVRQFLGLMGLQVPHSETSQAVVAAVPKPLTLEEGRRQLVAYFKAQNPKVVQRLFAEINKTAPEEQPRFIREFLEAARRPTLEYHEAPPIEMARVSEPVTSTSEMGIPRELQNLHDIRREIDWLQYFIAEDEVDMQKEHVELRDPQAAPRLIKLYSSHINDYSEHLAAARELLASLSTLPPQEAHQAAADMETSLRWLDRHASRFISLAQNIGRAHKEKPQAGVTDTALHEFENKARELSSQARDAIAELQAVREKLPEGGAQVRGELQGASKELRTRTDTYTAPAPLYSLVKDLNAVNEGLVSYESTVAPATNPDFHRLLEDASAALNRAERQLKSYNDISLDHQTSIQAPLVRLEGALAQLQVVLEPHKADPDVAALLKRIKSNVAPLLAKLNIAEESEQYRSPTAATRGVDPYEAFSGFGAMLEREDARRAPTPEVNVSQVLMRVLEGDLSRMNARYNLSKVSPEEFPAVKRYLEGDAALRLISMKDQLSAIERQIGDEPSAESIDFLRAARMQYEQAKGLAQKSAQPDDLFKKSYDQFMNAGELVSRYSRTARSHIEVDELQSQVASMRAAIEREDEADKESSTFHLRGPENSLNLAEGELQKGLVVQPRKGQGTEAFEVAQKQFADHVAEAAGYVRKARESLEALQITYKRP